MPNAIDRGLEVFVQTGGVQRLGNALEKRHARKQHELLVNDLQNDVFFSSLFGPPKIPQAPSGFGKVQSGGFGGMAQPYGSTLPELMQNSQIRNSLFLGSVFRFSHPKYGASGQQFVSTALKHADQFIGGDAPIRQINNILNSVANTRAIHGDEAAMRELQASLNTTVPEARAALTGFLRDPNPLEAVEAARSSLGGSKFAERVHQSTLDNQESAFSADQSIRVINARKNADLDVNREKTDSSIKVIQERASNRSTKTGKKENAFKVISAVVDDFTDEDLLEGRQNSAIKRKAIEIYNAGEAETPEEAAILAIEESENESLSDTEENSTSDLGLTYNPQTGKFE